MRLSLLFLFLAVSLGYATLGNNTQAAQIPSQNVIYWSNGAEPDGSPTGIHFVMRERIPREYMSLVRGQSGRSQPTWWINDDPLKPGPTPFATRLSKRPGVQFIELIGHEMWVAYRTGRLTEATLQTEAEFFKSQFEELTGKKFTLVKMNQFEDLIPDDCAVWKGTQYQCFGSTLYLPPGTPLDRDKIEDIPGIVLAGEKLHGGDPEHKGWGFIRKSRLHSWQEMRPKLAL